MIGIIAELKAKPGQGDALLAVMSEAAALVTAHEPGCLFYEVCRSRSDADVIKLFEIYADQAALDAHRTTPHFALIGGKLAPLIAAPPQVETLDAISGSITPPSEGGTVQRTC
ncbi:putative quinol monooxygenase [Sphingopyxis sp. 113P3]|uniref:putative quinol monooxygenase n=1 Tax=Sphingopyxis sp. (strain 113P3) TaxID=292913 RepID=UPI0009FAABCD|nr:putative quinol monooxygenase [Sphingopyxis sp. 113P3]